MGQKRPPLEYLITSSKKSLEAFELSRLNQSSNLRKELRQILDEWVDAEVDGRIARWILECRRMENVETDSQIASLVEPVRFGQLALAFVSSSADESAADGWPERDLVQGALVSRHRADPEAGFATVPPDAQAASPRLLQAPTKQDQAPIAGSQLLASGPRNSRPPLAQDGVRRALQAAENLADSHATSLLFLADGDEARNAAASYRLDLSVTSLLEPPPAAESGLRKQVAQGPPGRIRPGPRLSSRKVWQRFDMQPAPATRAAYHPAPAYEAAAAPA